MKKYVKQAPILLFIPIVLFMFMLNRNDFGGGERSLIQQSDQEIDKLEAVLQTIEGVGAIRVYYYEDQSKKTSTLSSYLTESDVAGDDSIKGILVVAEGGGDPYVRTTLLNAISTVFQLSEHQVVIVEMEKEREFIEDK